MFDPFDATQSRDAWAVLKALRDEGPLATVAGGLRYITRYEEARAALRDTVTFSNARPPVEKTEGKAPFNGKSATTATFSAPGDYVLLVVANDFSGEGGRGFQCCWTTVALKVSVK